MYEYEYIAVNVPVGNQEVLSAVWYLIYGMIIDSITDRPCAHCFVGTLSSNVHID